MKNRKMEDFFRRNFRRCILLEMHLFSTKIGNGDETMYQVDLNCDLGESFGNYKMGMDDQAESYRQELEKQGLLDEFGKPW